VTPQWTFQGEPQLVAEGGPPGGQQRQRMGDQGAPLLEMACHRRGDREVLQPPRPQANQCALICRTLRKMRWSPLWTRQLSCHISKNS
jgi:hypothetical protein